MPDQETEPANNVNGDATAHAPSEANAGDAKPAVTGALKAEEKANETTTATTKTEDVHSDMQEEDKNGAKEKVKEAPSTDTDTKPEDADSSTHSPDHKRKDPPVSVSAHESHYERKRGRGRGGSTRSTQGRNIKTRFDDQPESNDPDEIRRQVEFYFSDSNLPIDAYLLEQTGGHRNKPVPLKVIHNFKRMRHFQPFTAVQDAVRASNFLDLSEDDELTRKVPLDAKFTDNASENQKLLHTNSMSRSIYAKGFGEETKSTHLDIEAFFAPYGPLNSVRLRRKDDGEFKGSVFVEFESEEAQQAFLELDPKPQWQVASHDEGEAQGKELEVMSKGEYVELKNQGILNGDVKPRSPDRAGNNHRDGSGGGWRARRGNRAWIPDDEWKARRERDNRDGGDGFRDRGRGRGGRGGRGGRAGGQRGNGRRSPDFRDRGGRDGEGRGDRRNGDDDAPTSRAEAESKRAEKEAEGGAEKAVDGAAGPVGGKEGVGAPAEGAKKRAREDDGGEEAGGVAKKVKGDDTVEA